MIHELPEGERCMFYATLHDGVYLVDNLFNFYYIPASMDELQIICGQGPTLIAGFITHDFNNDRHVFLITDAFIVNGTDQTQETSLGNRLNKVRSIEILLVTMPHRTINLYPMVAEFFPFVDVKQILKRINNIRNRKGSYAYTDQRRRNLTSGIGLVPPFSRPIPHKHFPPHLTWQFQSKCALRVKIRFPSVSIGEPQPFYCSADRGRELIFMNNSLPTSSQRELQRIEKQCRESGQDKGAVIGIEYESTLEMWLPSGGVFYPGTPATYIAEAKATHIAVTECIGAKKLVQVFNDKYRSDSMMKQHRGNFKRGDSGRALMKPETPMPISGHTPRGPPNHEPAEVMMRSPAKKMPTMEAPRTGIPLPGGHREGQ